MGFYLNPYNIKRGRRNKFTINASKNLDKLSREFSQQQLINNLSQFNSLINFTTRLLLYKYKSNSYSNENSQSKKSLYIKRKIKTYKEMQKSTFDAPIKKYKIKIMNNINKLIKNMEEKKE